MRSLQHVLWRGAMALGLFLCCSASILALPQVSLSACVADTRGGLRPPSHVAELQLLAAAGELHRARC